MKPNKKHTHGFEVPSGYFDRLEKDMDIRMKEEAFPSEHGFTVPASYFDSIEELVMNRLEQDENQKSVKVIPLWPKRLAYVAAIAASLIIGWVILSPADMTKIDQLPMAEVENYIQEGGLDLEWHDIAQLLTDADIQEIPSDLRFEETQLESYLLEHLDETTLLME